MSLRFPNLVEKDAENISRKKAMMTVGIRKWMMWPDVDVVHVVHWVNSNEKNNSKETYGILKIKVIPFFLLIFFSDLLFMMNDVGFATYADDKLICKLPFLWRTIWVMLY